nr:hypothetical protein [Tanacetum cinerariifolium]
MLILSMKLQATSITYHNLSSRINCAINAGIIRIMVMIVNNSSHLSISMNQVTIKTIMYPVNHHISQADVEEVLQDKEKFMQDTQTFLEKFNRLSFEFTQRVLMIAWERIDKIKIVLTEPEEIPELMEYLEKYPDAVTTVLPTEEPEHSFSMGYKHLNTTPETKSDEIIKSGVEKLVPIPRECEVTSDDEKVSGELAHINPKIKEANFDLEEEILFVENLLDSLMDEIDLFLDTDELLPSNIESDGYDSEGDIHFLKELLADDSIPLPKNKSSNFDHQDNNPSFPRPPPEPPEADAEFEPNSGDVISALMNNIDEPIDDKCFDPGGEIDVSTNIEDDDYFPFMFVVRIFLPYLIYPEVSPLYISAESKDTIFDPGISVLEPVVSHWDGTFIWFYVYPNISESPIEIFFPFALPKDELIRGSSQAK